MSQYLLSEVYKELLNEAIIDQSTFLEKLVSIFEEKPSTEGEYGKVIKRIVEKVKETKLFSLKGKQNKKARKKAEVDIHKSLKELIGLDGEPINLKQIRPLYDSIIKYLTKKAESNIDDCIKSADYYMKEFYNSADKDEKTLISNGNFDFDMIFARTKFYQEFNEFKESLRGMTSSSKPIYEDQKIKIVYPTSPKSFNEYIKSQEVDLSWCTQSPGTWFSYNRDQFVMIMQEKGVDEDDPNYIISLKVKHSGNIDSFGSCDRYNNHMNQMLIDELVDEKVKLEISNKSASIKSTIDAGYALGSDPDKDYDVQIDGLLEINAYDDISSFLKMIANNLSHELFRDVSEYLFQCAIEENKIEQVLDLYTDIIASINIETNLISFGDLDWDSALIPNRDNPQKQNFCLKLLEKSLNRRSHEKYLITLLQLFKRDLPGWIGSAGDVNKNLKTSILNACNTNNSMNFKRVINTCLDNEYTILNIMKPDFVEILDTKGFNSYLNSNNGNLIKMANSLDIDQNFVRYESTYKFIESLVLSNKEKFSMTMQKNIDEKKSDLSIEDIDYNTLMNFVIQYSKSGTDASISKEIIKKYLVTFDVKDVDGFLSEIMSDVEMFDFMYEKNSKIAIAIFKIFIDRSSSRLVAYNEYSYNVFNRAIDILSQKDIFELLSVPWSNSTLNDLVKVIKVLKEKFNKSPGEVNKKLLDSMSTLLINSVSEVFKSGDSLRLNTFKSYFDYIKFIINYKGKELIDSISNIVSKQIWSKKLISYRSSSPNVESFITLLLTEIKIKNSLLNLDQILQAEDFSSSEDPFSLNIFETSEIKKFEAYYVLFYMINRKMINASKSIKIFTDYVNYISNSDPRINEGQPHDVYRALNTVLINFLSPTPSSSNAILSFVTQNFYNENMFCYRDLVFKVIKKSHNESIALDKNILKTIIENKSFKNTHDDIAKLILVNFVTMTSNGTQFHLEMKDRAIVRDTLVKGLRKSGLSLNKYYDFILSLVRQLDNLSRRHIYLAFPKEKDLNKIKIEQALLKLYLRLILN